MSNSIKFTGLNGTIKVILRIVEEQIDDSERKVKRQPIRRTSQILERKDYLGSEIKEKSKWIKLQMIIEDSGVGISQQNIEKLFSDYSRLKEHQDMNAKGTGLGLSICKKLINQMGGSVHVESVIKIGSRFVVTLQLKTIEKGYTSKVQSTISDPRKRE